MAEDFPSITPFVLRTGNSWCPRRLACTLAGRATTPDFFARWRVRDHLLASAAEAHATLRRPDRACFRPGEELVEEERAHFDAAADGYLERFGDMVALTVTGHGADAPMPSPRNKVRIGGGVDLLVVDDADAVELRQLELWHREVCADPGMSWDALCAVARLRGWLDGRPLRIVHADLLGGALDVYEWDPADAGALGQRFADRLAELRALADLEDPRPGHGCAQCGHLADCPALREPR